MKSAVLTTRGDAHTFTYIEGDGPPVVMIHGMISTGDSWVYTFEALKSRYQAIAPDLPGHGRSSGGRAPYGLDYYTDWLCGFLDVLKIHTATLIGQSMGGAICAAFTIRHPERVSRLVLVDSLGMSSKIPWRAVRNITGGLPDYFRANLTHRDDPYLLRCFQPWVFLDPWGSPRATIEQMAVLNKPREREVAWAGTRLLLADFRTRRQRKTFVENLSRIQIPTLVLWGRHDGILALENAHEGIAHMPQATCKIFEDSAHEPMLEQPDEFNRAVEAFLDEGTGHPASL